MVDHRCRSEISASLSLHCLVESQSFLSVYSVVSPADRKSIHLIVNLSARAGAKNLV